MNLGNVLNWANAILLEGFKDDVLNGYKKLGYDTEDKKLLSAIKTLNSENEIKEFIKREVGKVPNVGLAVAKKYTPEEFIGVVTKSKREINAKRKKLLYAKSRTNNASQVSNEYYLYPCRTFEEAHEAAFAHTGNLKRLSREDREKFFKEEYDIDIPKPATHYETKKTPAEMLEFMKECPVFMEPTWCVCADKKFWNRYKLKATKKEDANCFVVISKTHPNVRFCVTRDVLGRRIRQVLDGDSFISVNSLGEFRDIWQIGGDDEYNAGASMASLAFGDVERILKYISYDSQKYSLEDLGNGAKMYKGAQNLKDVDTNFAHLHNGLEMFERSSITKFTANVPYLSNGNRMFCSCFDLKEVSTSFPVLSEAVAMFSECYALEEFSSGMPKLDNGYHTFSGCKNMKRFSANVDNLRVGDSMFSRCYNLTSFSSKLPSLQNGSGMFNYCKLDKPSVINILTSIPKVNGSRITITTGYNWKEDKDTLSAIENADNKGWRVWIDECREN